MSLFNILIIGLIIAVNVLGIISITFFLIKENREKKRTDTTSLNSSYNAFNS